MRLALHRTLQRGQVEVAGTATVGGVFDIERFLLSALANETVATVPLYVSSLLLAYGDIYDLVDRPAEVFRRPSAATVGRVPGNHVTSWVLAMPRAAASFRTLS